VKLTSKTKIYIVTNAYSDEEWVDVIESTDLAGLQSRLKGGLNIQKDNVAIFTNKEEACAEAKLRLINKSQK